MRDKEEERETEVVMEEEEVVMEVRWVAVAEVEVGEGKVYCQDGGGGCATAAWGTCRDSQMGAKGKVGWLVRGKGNS